MVSSSGRLRDNDDDLVKLRRLALAQDEANRRGLVIGHERDRLIYHAAEWDVRFERRCDLVWLSFVAFACGACFSYLLAAFFGWPI